MLVLIPLFLVLLASSPVGSIDNGEYGEQLREASSPVSMTGKPIKIPPKKV